MNAGNFKKKIEQDEGWSNAFYCCQTELIDLANDRMYDILSSEKTDDKTIVAAYDKVMKYDLAKKQLEQGVGTDDTDDTSIVFGFGGDK